MAHGLPVDRFRRGFTVGILLQNFVLKLFRVRPLLLHKNDARKPQQQLCCKFVFGQIPLDAVPLFAVFVQHQGSWRPDGVKAVEPGRVFLDVDCNGDKFLIDKGSELRVSVRFGFQPSACPSRWSCAEVNQHGLVFCLGLAERSVYVLVP